MQERDKGFKTRLGGSADLHNYFNYLKININKQAEKRGRGWGRILPNTIFYKIHTNKYLIFIT